MSEAAGTLGRLHREAVALTRAGETGRAEHLLKSILALDPLHGPALNSLCGLLVLDRRRDQALHLISRAVAQQPGVALLHRIAAEILRLELRFEEAMDEADRAVAADPRDHQALMIRSSIHHDRLAIRRSAADARRALAVQPAFAEAHLRLGELHLLQGDFAAGWPDYDWSSRIAMAQPLIPPAHQRPDHRRWDGEPLGDGPLLLVADQGFGDAIQFGRYLPWAAGRCGRLAVACTATLVPLLSQIAPAANVFHRWAEMPAFAAFAPLSGLPRLHGTTLGTIPPVPHLTPPPAAAALWRERLAGIAPAGARRIGLVWAGRPTHPNDANRTATLADLAPVAACRNVFLVALQLGPARREIEHYAGPAPLLDAGRLVADFGDTAAVIAQLDLVITVDSAVAHLAGSMGKPVWIMLPYAPDWRWMLQRTDSPWYPGARLFRAPAPRAWEKVAAAMAEALR